MAERRVSVLEHKEVLTRAAAVTGWEDLGEFLDVPGHQLRHWLEREAFIFTDATRARNVGLVRRELLPLGLPATGGCEPKHWSR